MPLQRFQDNFSPILCVYVCVCVGGWDFLRFLQKVKTFLFPLKFMTDLFGSMKIKTLVWLSYQECTKTM